MKIIKKFIQIFSIPPIAFSIYFVLTLYAHNIGELQIPNLMTPLIGFSVVAFLIGLLMRFFLKSNIKGDVFSSLFMLLFFSYENLFLMFNQFMSLFKTVTIDQSYIFAFLLSILCIFIFIKIKNAKRDFSSVYKFLYIMSLIAIFFPISKIYPYELSQRNKKILTSPMELPQLKLNQDNNNLPDIYYIVPDSYSSSEVLSKYYGYDNSTFLQFLTKNNFFIASQSTSNYPKTFLSISSSLNMEYLDYLEKEYKNSSDQTVITPLIENNNVLKLLKRLGYKYYQMGSWWGPTNYNNFADINFLPEKENKLGLDDFSYLVVQSTMIDPIIHKLFPEEIFDFSDESKRDRIVYQFNTLLKVINLPGPKFVFVHLITPHGPFVFDENCNFTSAAKRYSEPVEGGYIHQVNCINQKLESTITAILQNPSSHPPVILLQSDEGSPFLGGKLDPTDNWKTASTDLIKEKFPIFTAYYLPNVSQSALYPSITPVN